ncbi:cytochrome c subunit VB [Choiromyces venosus 120613-1]|uniref:Cytochrome c oxidase subunit 4, mitochondrial n=1 Tax=Choiromyces venosus 120613-1 TaxID=1336337 RepID=A0A3N4K1Q5_9PEZI|nr:cytochrome c subunit VB [Choiromyces venosus 120613-1]
MFARPAISTLRKAIVPTVRTRLVPAAATTTRTFVSAGILRSDNKKALDNWPIPPEIKTEEDLLPPGAAPGEVPTDYNQATGLERLEILGKVEGVDIFDMKPLDASRRGTLDNPIVVQSFGKERYLGCTGYPADSHTVIWLTVSKDRPIERCPECGGVYKMEYVGAEEEHHGHDDHHHGYVEPKTMADFVKPEYR